MKIILASASPRRQELLKRLYSDFIVEPADIDETLPEDISPEFAPVFLAAEKAHAISSRYPQDMVIASDTVVICDHKIMGKPLNEEDAREMLHSLSGRTHKVITGCCIQLGEQSTAFSEESYVTFYPLNEKEIEEYLATGEPMGKAGAYGIQGLGALFVQKIEGDFYNIVGFPIARLRREIRDLLQDAQVN